MTRVTSMVTIMPKMAWSRYVDTVVTPELKISVVRCLLSLPPEVLKEEAMNPRARAW